VKTQAAAEAKAAPPDTGAAAALTEHRRLGMPLLAQRLLALFGCGVLLFNFPLLKLWLTDGTVFGLPLLPVALFAAWLLLIGVLAWLMEQPAEA
jgi:hypothetical protein